MTAPVPVLPERSRAQKMEALGRANEIRCARAQLKRDVAEGRQLAHAVIAEPPAWAASMRVRHLLLAVPSFGPRKADTLLGRAGASQLKTLQGLTRRQRDALVELLLAHEKNRLRKLVSVKPATAASGQSEVALAYAQRMRLERAALHAKVSGLPKQEGRAELARLLLDPPECMRAAAVVDVLQWPHQAGLRLARATLAPEFISPHRRVGRLTYRQRAVLAVRLRQGTLAGSRRTGKGNVLRNRLFAIVEFSFGLTEAQMVDLTGADPEEVAFEAGALLLANRVQLRPDGTYVARPAGCEAAA